VATRVTSTRLIGRATELAELEAALQEAAEGRASFAFVAGESGVGKSRLVTELSARARERGARTLCGECVELGEGELPYAPLVAALRPLARDNDPAIGDLPDAAHVELAALLPEVDVPTGVQRPEEGVAGAAQRRLFEALLALLERLGRDEPVLLLLEDIHWADSSTRAFLAFLARAMSTERVLAVATYRSDELHRRHPLRPLLAELERDARARRLELARFSREELAAQLEDILDEPPDAELVERLHARSEGNPLFAEELLAAGGDGRGALPPTLRDALMVRTERLPDAAQEVLRLLAVAQRADHALLADAGELDGPELRAALREAAAGHLIVAGPDGLYRFRHALLREVVHDDLLPGEHAELHLALARALERRAAAGGDGAWISAGIAHHYRSAGDQPAALRASVAAARAASKVHAHGEAAALLERALEIWDRVPDAERLAEASHAEILVRAAAAHRSNVDDHRRFELLKLAVAEIDEQEHPKRLAEVLGEMASAQWSLGRGEDSRATLRRAVALLPSEEPSRERADLLARRVAFLMLQGRYGEVKEAAPEALEVARAVGAEEICGPVLNRLGSSLFALGEQEAGQAAFDEAIAISRATGQAVDAAFVGANLADALHRSGRSREALATAIAAFEELPRGSRAAHWLAMERAEIEFGLGEWQAAEEHLPQRGRITGTTLANAHIVRAGLLLGQGDTAAARPLLEECARILAHSLEPQFLAGCGALRGELERRVGALDTARAVVEEAIDRIEYCSEDGERLAEVACVGVVIEADAAERARDLGDDAAERRARLSADMMNARVQAAAEDLDRAVTDAHAANARAELARAEGSPDPELYAASAEAWSALERPYPAAVARWREAEAHLRGGDRTAAVGAARAAAEIAGRLGARWLTDEVEAFAARARLRLADEAAAEPEPAAEEAAFGLTPRELQVLALLAGGATNREIGAQLFMAEKTASVHVSRILSKLDVRSRTEAAAVAHRHGLAAAAALRGS
jgi:DNA-binding CsgD family transcriptional regulator